MNKEKDEKKNIDTNRSNLYTNIYTTRSYYVDTQYQSTMIV